MVGTAGFFSAQGGLLKAPDANIGREIRIGESFAEVVDVPEAITLALFGISKV